jgi:hypothetical protein
MHRDGYYDTDGFIEGLADLEEHLCSRGLDADCDYDYETGLDLPLWAERLNMVGNFI